MRHFACLCAAIVVLGEMPAAGAMAPAGFAVVRVAQDLLNPTAMQFAPDGRLFVCQQDGELRVIKNGVLLPTPFLTVTVSSASERGLLGVAFDPDFASNRYVYVYYTATTPAVHNRVSRFTANAMNPDVAEPGSEVVILDLENVTAAFHNGGAIDFGPDGKLYVAVGDDTVGMNAQSMGNRFGKILRIEKDGSIPEDNPFYTTATGPNRAIWAMGLRNPFTFAFHRDGTELFINDVGQAAWEEINVGAPGANFGWPDTEGETTEPGFTSPLYAYGHADGACAITGGAFYAPEIVTFPAEYLGQYFFADYCAGWIRRLDPATGTVRNFLTAASAVVDIKVSSDGELYYLARGGSEAVFKVEFRGSLPVITTQPASAAVKPGTPVTFSVRASGPLPLTYQWQRNGIDIPGATAPDYVLSSALLSDTGSSFRALVTNGSGGTLSDEALLTVTTNMPPTAVIINPAAGTMYSGGSSFTYSGNGTDPEDGVLPDSAFTWRVDFHHDTHVHPFIPPTTGARGGTFTIPTIGETATNVWYRIYLTVRDSGGTTHTAQRDIRPRTVTLTLASNPPGLRLRLDGQPFTAPLTFGSVVGIRRNISAATFQALGGVTYELASWSDGGADAHDILTPAVNTSYVATYRAHSEVCDDDIDNDGDGQIDEGCQPPSAQVPSAPRGLQRTVIGNGVYLTWRSPITGGNPTGYVVDAGLASTQTIHSLPTGKETFLRVANVGPGKYYVRVRAVNAVGSSPPSNEVTVTIGCNHLPSPPRALTAQIDGNRVSLTWVDDEGCNDTSFRVRAGSTPGATDIADIPAQTTELAATAPPGTYYVRVVTISPFGVTAPSNEVAVTIDSNACHPPNIPTSAAAQTAGRQVTVRWQPTNDTAAVAADDLLPISYVLEVGSAAGAADLGTYAMGRALGLTTVVPAGTYYARIRPANVCGFGTASNELTVRVP